MFVKSGRGKKTNKLSVKNLLKFACGLSALNYMYMCKYNHTCMCKVACKCVLSLFMSIHCHTCLFSGEHTDMHVCMNVCVWGGGGGGVHVLNERVCE